ncbi:MAG: alpha/beta hydrolase [Sphingomonas sp.]|jgi:acetyl esterase/lipase|uniref:alpha/beta hydrolase n=1 Tax=Sphingomonas sp. TaxID=28214 RepID=UPI0035675A4E
MMFDLTRRDLAINGLAGLAAASLPHSAGMAQAPTPRVVDLSLVDPQLRAAAREAAPITTMLSALSTATLPSVRAAGGKVSAFEAGVPVDRRSIPGGRSAPDVVIYVINARAGTARPAILHTHGGGFVVGTAANDVPRLQAMAAALDCVIVTVDYRLAPEVGYQGAIEDNYAGLRWLFANAALLGADPQRIAVMGESAGGGHAALLALAARDRGEFRLAFQLLVYPMLDDRTGSSRPVPATVGQIIWTPAANRFGWGAFLGQTPGTAKVPAAAVPARVRDLSGLPPAFICVGALDLFVEEDMEYARRLIGVGVPTELLVVPGAFHGFDNGSPDARVVKQFNDAKLNALRRIWATGIA